MLRKFSFIFVLLLASPAFAGLFLTSTSDTIRMNTSAVGSIDYSCNYVDHTTTAYTPGDQDGNVTSAGNTDICPAPGASTQRQIKWLSVTNVSSTVTNVITISDYNGANTYRLMPQVTLAPGESFSLDYEGKLTVRDSTGREKLAAEDFAGYSGRVYDWYKVGAASEAIGLWHTTVQNTGIPSAWSANEGAGLDGGVATDCNTVNTNSGGYTNVGAPYLPNPSTGSLYMVRGNFATSTAHMVRLMDVLWYLGGIAETTTTAQVINSQTAVPWPARDGQGSTNGEGVGIAIYVNVATTNAGAVTNTTLSYTNSQGTAGRTATIASFPATAVAGNITPFQLQAGDTGVRSVQSLTLGTSYGGGTVYLIAYRNLASFPNPVANVGSIAQPLSFNTPPGVRLYNGTCLVPYYVASATTATNVTGDVNVLER